MYVCVCMRMHVYTYQDIFINLCMYAYVYVYVCIHVYVGTTNSQARYFGVCMCMHVYIGTNELSQCKTTENAHILPLSPVCIKFVSIHQYINTFEKETNHTL